MKKVSKFFLSFLKGSVLFILEVLAESLKSSAKAKEYEPTQHEIACGEKLPFTGEYFIPDDKHSK